MQTDTAAGRQRQQAHFESGGLKGQVNSLGPRHQLLNGDLPVDLFSYNLVRGEASYC